MGRLGATLGARVRALWPFRSRAPRLESQERGWSLLLQLPLVAFLIVFFVFPLTFVILFAFDYYDANFLPTGRFSIDNFSEIWSAALGTLFARTGFVAGMVTLLCFLLAYPAAYYIAQLPPRRREFLVMLLIIPFWTSFLLRTYSLMTLFESNGIVNALIQGLGLSSEPVFRTRNIWSVIWSETYTFMPFMVLPLYANLEKLPRSTVEASYILGAGRIRTFLRVVLPQSVPGILAGSLLVFIIALGELIIPILVGGVEAQFLLGNAIYERAGLLPGHASALGLLLMAVVLGVSFVYVRLVSRGGFRL